MTDDIRLNEVPDSLLLPDDFYTLAVDEIEATESKAGRYMIRVVFKVAEGSYEGATLFDYFAIGTTEDPQAKRQDTWNQSSAARRLKRLTVACLVPFGPVSQIIEALKNQRFSGRVVQEADRGTDPKYAGQVRNRVAAMYALGTAPSRPIAGGAVPAPVNAPSRVTHPPVAVSSASTVPCPFCGDSVARGADYATHVRERHPDEA